MVFAQASRLATRPVGADVAAACLGLAMAGVVLFAPQVLNDGDTYWHLATGDWILSHGRPPQVDVFSHSAPGAPWVAHEWLSEALMALAFRAGGWTGLVLLFAAAAGSAMWMMARRVARDLTGISLLLVCLLAWGAMAPSLFTRPHLLALPALVGWVIGLLKARDADRAPPLALAALMTVWANLHGGYAIGLALAGVLACEAIAASADRWAAVRSWALFGAASLAAALLTPHGVHGLLYPFQVMSMESLPHIAEWRPADFSRITPFEISLLVAVYACLSRGVKVAPVRLLILLGLLHLALQHSRHQFVLAAIAPLLLAGPLAEAFGAERKPPQPAPPWSLALALCLALALISARLALPLHRSDNITTPKTALERIPASLRGQPVLNNYAFGGYLIFKGVRPFIDGRSDMYGDEFTGRFIRATDGDDPLLRRMLERYRIAWTIFLPSDDVVAALDRQPGWRRLYADRFAVVHVRTDALKAEGSSR